MAERTFTREELRRYNGAEGQPTYIAYKGTVYDVSASPLFQEGMHFEHYAGEDLTAELADAPHGEEVFESMPVVGYLVS